MARWFVIPVFIPQEGCRHDCLFCDQEAISGAGGSPLRAEDVQAVIDQWLQYTENAEGKSRTGTQVQVAFYGGTFTGLTKQRQEDLLGAVQPYLRSGQVDSLRCSTRPDLVDPERIALLRAYGVDLVELGVQSLEDELLQNCRRGHTAGQAITAIQQLKAAGLRVGVQLMLGLPGERFVHLRRTVAQVIRQNPWCVRIYPLLVLKGSALARMYACGDYQPLTLDRAVLLAAWMKKRFTAARIPVIRMGLQPGESLERALIAGPYHPAFGQMVASRLMLGHTRRLLAGLGGEQTARLLIAPGDQPVFHGQRQMNRQRLEELGLWRRFQLVPTADIPRGQVRMEGIEEGRSNAQCQ
ncbi:MAG: radical SAM protein [Desulfobulbus propionicus]|nr:MAG: radical SAM protein [Desulfobulbus propionicus]